jgi:hypothetical protein
VVDGSHYLAANIVVCAHAVVEANQRQAAGVRTRVADEFLRAVAVPGAFYAAKIQANADAPVVVIALVSSIAQGEGTALVVLAVALELVGICVDYISWIPASACLVAPLPAHGFVGNACILAALPTLHAGTLAISTAVARAIVSIGNAFIPTAFQALLARASIIFSLVLTRTTDDHCYASKSRKNPKSI